MRHDFFNKKFWIVMGTMLVIGSILSYYLFIVVAHKEAELVEKGYRVLEQIDKNLNSKIDNLNKTAEFIYNACLSATRQEPLNRLKKNWLGNGKSYPDYSLLIRAIEDSVKIPSIYAYDNNWESFYKPNSDFYYFQFRTDTTIELSLKSSYESIVKGVFMPGEFFDDLVILKDPEKVKKKVIGDKSVLVDSVCTQVIYQTFKNRIDIREIDSLLNYSKGIYSGGIVETSVADSKYKVFVHRLVVKNKGMANRTEVWTLLGFMKASTYHEKTREVNSVLLFSVLLLFVLIVFAFPILKLAIMSGVERLQITNVFAVGLSLTAGISIITLILISTGDYLRGYYGDTLFTENSQSRKVTQLANTIQSNFYSEVRTITEQLYALRGKYDSLKKDVKPTNRKPFRLIPDSSSLFTIRRDYNQVIWIDSDGKLDLTLAQKPVSALFDQLDLKDRTYFRKIQAHDFWRMDKKEFYVESIISWYDGNLEAVVAVPAKEDANVLIMATTLRSVSDPVLPPGYSFCIVDENGEVQFHSDKTKNLRENLLNETERNSNVLACLHQRVKDTFTGVYQGKDHYFSISPIEGTALFVVAIKDMDYYQTPLEMAIRLTALLILAMFALFGIHNFLLYGTTFKPTKLKIQRFFLSWLNPQTSESFRLRYSLMTLINLVFILIFIFLPALLPDRTRLVFLLIPVYFLYFSYVLVGLWDSGKHRSENIKTIFRHKFTWLTVLLVVMLLSFVSTVSDPFSKGANSFVLIGIVIPVLIAGLGYGIDVLFTRSKVIRHFFSKPTYSMHYYYFFLVSWLIVSGVFPVVNFYKLGIHEESLAWLKFNQLETCKSLHAFRETNDHTLDADTAEEYGNYAYATGDFIESDPLEPTLQPLSHFDKVLSVIRTTASDLPEKLQYGSYSSSSDSTWSSVVKNESVVTTTYRDTSLAARVPSGSSPSDFSFFIAALSVLVIIFLVWLLYTLLRFICKKIYGIEIFSSRRSSDVSITSLKDQIHLSSKIFLVGLPYSGKADCIRELKETWEDYVEINWISDWGRAHEILLRGKSKNVIITHFEYGMNSHTINQKKLRILAKLHQDPENKIIISSSVQHVAILDFYEIMIDRALSKDKSDDAYSEIKEYRLAFRQWQNILNGFVTIYQSLVVKPVRLTHGYNNKAISETVQHELKHGVFLRTLEPLVFNYYKGLSQAEENQLHKPDVEDIILRIEVLADAYYQAIWNSFTKNEKFLLYDLAKDRFINTKNIKEIKILMEKGVIHMTTSLQLMNTSFCNFILSVVREDEELAMQQEMKLKGSWKSAQLVLLLSLLGLAIFFTLAQQNLLQNFNAMLTVAGAVLALVARFGGLFGGGAKQKDT